MLFGGPGIFVKDETGQTALYLADANGRTTDCCPPTNPNACDIGEENKHGMSP